MTPVFRTPEERFVGLPDFDATPSYMETGDGLRIAYIDAPPPDGAPDAPPVVFLHGEPTWSFLWRTTYPPVRDAGFRCLLPDMAGFGRSDKPTDLEWYTYDRHTAVLAEWLDHLDLRDATIVVHDWGGPIGLRLAVDHPDRFGRIVVLDTGLFTGSQRMSEAWERFGAFVERTEDLPVAMLVERACAQPIDEAALAAYDAPFPEVAAKAGTRAFPLIIPRHPDAPGAAEGRRVLEALGDGSDTRPRLVLWADSDPILPVEMGRRLAERIGAPPPEVIEGASHFLQEDRGPQIGARIAEWLHTV